MRPAIYFKFLVTLVIGVSIGYNFAYVLLSSSEHSSHNDWFGKHEYDKELHKFENRTVAEEMGKKVRILCWIMTTPENHERKALHVKQTWGARCNILLFMSSAADSELPTIALPVEEGYNFLWGKTKAAFQYIYDHHRNDADWFLKADDDTYVVVENLRFMLSAHSPQEPVYFGCRLKRYVDQGYMSGGAGYVLSQTALDWFVTKALPSPEMCKQEDEGIEDIEMGMCLANVGVKAGDSRDSLGRGRFFPFIPEEHLIPEHLDNNTWYWKYTYYKSDAGLDCCSDSAISFHYIEPNQIYVIDQLQPGSGAHRIYGRMMGFMGSNPANHKFLLTLVIGISTGFSFAYILLITSEYSSRNGWFSRSDNCYPHNSNVLGHIDKDGHAASLFDFGKHGQDEEFHKSEDRTVAEEMAKKVRVLCWIMTGPSNHESKAIHVKKTWGPRCNILLFMSSTKDSKLPTIALPVKEGHDMLWGKTKAAFQYIYDHHRNDADWFLKADDDTYVVVENLRYMLSTHRPQDPVYFGCRFKPYVDQGYMSGGAGYVLSRTALDRFVTKALPSPEMCKEGAEGSEDVEIGNCLSNVGVKAGDSRDPLGRGRFFPFDPEHHLVPGVIGKTWYWDYIYYKSEEGSGCCSDNAVSFHYVSPNQMYVLEYLIYHLKPFGINYQKDTMGVNQKKENVHVSEKSKQNMANETSSIGVTIIQNIIQAVGKNSKL